MLINLNYHAVLQQVGQTDHAQLGKQRGNSLSALIRSSYIPTMQDALLRLDPDADYLIWSNDAQNADKEDQ